MNNNIPTEALNVPQTVEVECQGGDGKMTVTYVLERVVGSGSFGVVYLARLESGQQVAIKKVLQDRRYKNRELQIMRELQHPNITHLHSWFRTAGSRTDEVYLNIIMEFFPDSVYSVNRRYSRQRQAMPLNLVRILSYQLLRSLAYLHSQNNCCHRDVKPQNLLTDAAQGRLVLCDFGSAKHLDANAPNVAYICSRFYRAPELIFGSTQYTTAIDVWSAGCVIGELLLGTPLFAGDTGVDQLVQIIQVLGTPSRQEIYEMNRLDRSYTEHRFPHIRRREWSDVFRGRVPDDILSLIDGLLRYTPRHRLTAIDALAHPAFDRLREPGPPVPELGGIPGPQRMPNGQLVPDFFNFTQEELNCASPEARAKLVPQWYITYSQALAQVHQ